MCNKTGIEFGERLLTRELVGGREVLEVGSMDVNGSLRPHVESLSPSRYLGVDMAWGPRVDAIVDASQIVKRFGAESFDVVITTEMLEHVRNWQVVVSQLKRVLRPGGLLLVTTRSLGFPYHGYPSDFWRYEPEDITAAFSDLEILAMERDSDAPGIFMLARRPTPFLERPPSIKLHSMITGHRERAVSNKQVWLFNARRRAAWSQERSARYLGRKTRTARRRITRQWRTGRRQIVGSVWRRLPHPVRMTVKRVLRRA